jgi:hypothetical protein
VEVRGVKVLKVSPRHCTSWSPHAKIRLDCDLPYDTLPSATPGHLSRAFETVQVNKGRATSYSLKLVVYLVILHIIMIQDVEESSAADFSIVRMKEVLEHFPDDLNTLNSGKIGDPVGCSTYCDL